MQRKIRGIRILRKSEDSKIAVKLLSINDRIFAVAIRFSYLGLLQRKRRFEFESLEDAEYFYDKACIKLLPSGFQGDHRPARLL